MVVMFSPCWNLVLANEVHTSLGTPHGEALMYVIILFYVLAIVVTISV